MITYGMNVSLVNDICGFLMECDGGFVPKLSARVDIHEYASKIFTNAIRFEALLDGAIVGLIAMYVNGSFGYITTVSVRQNHTHCGVASSLMANCIEHSKINGILKINLEVNERSFAAIKLYRKFGFEAYRKDNESMFMQLILKQSLFEVD